MIIGYILFNIIIYYFSLCYYHKQINPVSVYSFVWIIAVGFHECGLIRYNNLSLFTWFIICFMQVIYTIACFMYKTNSHEQLNVINEKRLKDTINKYIILTSTIASIGIISSIFKVISIFGYNLIYNITNVYAARVYDNVDFQVVPYVGAFIYITLPLAGIYVKRYKLSFPIIITFVLVALNSLTSGAKGGIVFSILLFIYGYVLTPTIDLNNNFRYKNKRWGLYVGSVILIALFVGMSYMRTAENQMPYATDLFYNIFGGNIFIYKTIAYIANPIGVLNEYLKECTFSFGQNTFLPIYNIIAKFGLIDRVEQYQSWYNIPAPCNVGTWLREIIEDFMLPGAMFCVYCVGYLLSKFFQKAINGNWGSLIMSAILMMIVTMSFFDWKLRTSGLWIALFFGYYIGKRINKLTKNV